MWTTPVCWAKLIARREWVVLTGGRDVGVMDAACQGAKKVPGSLTIGVLPSARERVSKYVDLAIITEMGNARNNVNVMSSNVVVVCGLMGAGTVSEVALALKAGKPVILVGATPAEGEVFQETGRPADRCGGDPGRSHWTHDEAV
jgi:uncharacterized protein (TIGR00725 family)